MLPVAAVVGALLLALLPWATTPTAFVALWALIGITQAGCLYEPCFSLITRSLGAAARPAITRVTLVAGLASSLAFPLGTTVAGVAGWSRAIWLFAAIVLLGAACLWLGARSLPATGPRRTDRDDPADSAAAQRALARPVFWLLAISFPMIAFNHNALINLLLPLLDARGVTAATAVLAASLVGPMQVAGRMALMTLGGSRSSTAIAMLAFSAMTIAALALLAADGEQLVPLFLFVGLQGAGYGLTSILRPAVTAELLGRAGFGQISGRLALPYLAAAAAAPLLGAMLASAGGYDLMIVVLGIACAMGVGGLALANRLHRRG